MGTLCMRFDLVALAIFPRSLYFSITQRREPSLVQAVEPLDQRPCSCCICSVPRRSVWRFLALPECRDDGLVIMHLGLFASFKLQSFCHVSSAATMRDTARMPKNGTRRPEMMSE